HSLRAKLESNQRIEKARMLESFQIAVNELSNETGTIAVHLGKSQSDHNTITLIDSLGTKHCIVLNSTPFVLQLKKPLLTQAFLSSLKTDKTQAKEILDALLRNIASRASKGVLNRDRSF